MNPLPILLSIAIMLAGAVILALLARDLLEWRDTTLWKEMRTGQLLCRGLAAVTSQHHFTASEEADIDMAIRRARRRMGAYITLLSATLIAQIFVRALWGFR